MNNINIHVRSFPKYHEVSLFSNTSPDIRTIIAFMQCMSNGNNMELFPMQTYERHGGFGNIILAMMYRELKNKGVKEVYASRNMALNYTDKEYENYLKQVGFKQTWSSYLFGSPNYYAKIPNPIGDEFCNNMMNKYKFTPIQLFDSYTEYSIERRLKIEKIANLLFFI